MDPDSFRELTKRIPTTLRARCADAADFSTDLVNFIDSEKLATITFNPKRFYQMGFSERIYVISLYVFRVGGLVIDTSFRFRPKRK